MRIRYIWLAVLLISARITVGQSFVSVQDGALNDDATWGATSNPVADNNFDDLTIGHNITHTGNLTLNSNGGTAFDIITISSSGSLTINGNLTLNNFDEIDIQGDLIVTGNLEFGNGQDRSIIFNGNITVGGNLTIDGGFGDEQSLFIDGGQLSVAGDFETDSPVESSGLVTVDGDFILNAGFGVTPDLQIDAGEIVVGGSLDTNGPIAIEPGAILNITLDLIVDYVNFADPAFNEIRVGDGSGGTDLAYLIVGNDLVLDGNADIGVDTNGRVVVFGDLTSPDGFFDTGTVIELAPGGIGYVEGDIDLNNDGATTDIDNPANTLYLSGTLSPLPNGETPATPPGNASDLANDHPDFFAFINDITPGVPLPVTLSFFEVNMVDGQVVLTWQTLTEENFSHFEIERSTDGQSWEYLGFVDGKGRSYVPSNYSFYDYHMAEGYYYYRLVANDFDGYTEYFGPVFVQYTLATAPSLISRPHDAGYLVSSNRNLTLLKVIDINGREYPVVSFDDAFLLNVPNGIYILIAQDDEGNQWSEKHLLQPR